MYAEELYILYNKYKYAVLRDSDNQIHKTDLLPK